MKWYKSYCLATLVSCILTTTATWAAPPQPENPPSEATPSPAVEATEGFTVFPVGVNVGKRNVISSTSVRGKEDGTQAINFPNWLVSYDAVIQALKFKVTTLPDGQREVRSPGLVTRIDPKKLRTDPELGLVFSVQELQTLFGVTAEFDINEYAIQLQVPWLNRPSQPVEQTETPVVLEGLPRINAPSVALTAIEQRVNTSFSSGSSVGQTSSLNYQGDLTAVGTVMGGSWFIQLNQPDLNNPQTWRLVEAQFLRQKNQADYIVGSQPSFWRSQGSGDYWGFTTIQRQGFTPPTNAGSGFTPEQRLQASQIGRTISGRAEPGTLVQLTQGLSDRVIADVLVDSSGIYRFENIPFGGQSVGGNYRLLLYPKGQLTAQPEIRQPTFSNVPGQLPTGAEVLIVSGGWERASSNRENPSLLGELSGLRGGIAKRWGLSEDLTVGLGGIYDESPRGLGELFFRPKDLPLEVAVSVLAGDSWDINTDIRFAPSPSISARFNSDRLSNRFNFNWSVNRCCTLLGTYDSGDAAAIGGQITFSGKNAFTFARATLDTHRRFRWNLTQRLGRWEFTQEGNEIGSASALTYNLQTSSSSGSEQSLLLGYETRSSNHSNKLATLVWRYRSKARSVDAFYLWEGQLGYGIGSQGSGVIASLGTTVIPGLLVRGLYQGVSLTSNQPSFRIELVSSLNMLGGIRAGSRRSDYFRTQGGLLIQPFFDRNNNDKRDAGEDFYTQAADELLVLNNQSIKSFRPEVQGDGISVRLPPGSYRLDIDPAGFPPDWRATVDAYAVDVVAGSYTPVPLPLILSYTISGIVTDAQGKPINGARVEAVSTSSGQKVYSVTNGAGVYYLEGLQQGTYTLQINGKPAQPSNIKLDKSSQPFQELNLQQR